jgi:hypothetical protein
LSTESAQGLILSAKELNFTPRVYPITKSHLLAQVVGETDITRIVPHLLGVTHSPQETLDVMKSAVKEALKSLIKTKGKKVAKETLKALLHNGPCSIDSLSNLDEMWGHIVNKVKHTASDRGLGEYNDNAEYNGMTPEAREFKKENTASLEALIIKYGLEKLINRQLVRSDGDNIIDVTEECIVHTLSRNQITKLSEILPEIFNKNIDTPIGSLDLEERILRELWKVGNDFTRLLIMIMKEKQLEQRMGDYFSSH